jgi:hypothetical protein
MVHTENFFGGVHPNHGVLSFNYDVKNRKVITITDFITLKQVSDYARVKIKADLTTNGGFDQTAEEMLDRGTDPMHPENFEVFTFLPDSITVYFPEYQVGPYTLGEQSVVLPRNK